ncbi:MULTISPECIES: hypothetical protein [unclassified Solwaraspora]|uniref:hypothetical protein n=1 Tax=unclassified Solwaraspora TaxID=2627926 RepID=UPI00259BAAB6|nr:hypothetical protein [Solwaraspora sp. WMMA2056]WJK42090.1 hypothetical protein O7608_06775 [Solwaraspora sp. WMMA2056]
MTTDRTPHLELLRELTHGNPAIYQERCQQLDEAGWQELGLVLGAAFFLAARERLGDRTTRGEVIHLVADIRSKFADTTLNLDPELAEKLLVSALTGETDDVEDAEQGALLETELVVLWHLLSDAPADKLDRFLAEVGQLAEEWSEED